MQIESIHLKNIKSHRDVSLSFAAGINVLAGPNGVGKSTVFEAIGYALFGVDARDFVTNVERFLSIGAKKGEVAVTFRLDDGTAWRVTRTVGGGVKWLLARENDGVFEVEEHANIRETETRLAGLLGLANGRPLAEQFKLVIGPFQNEFLGPFVIKQATKRQDAFDEILGIDAWRKTFKGTSGLLTAVRNRIEVLEAGVEARREQVAVLPERQQALADLQAGVGEQRTALAAQRQTLETVARQLSEQERQEQALRKAETELHELEIRIKNGEEKVAEQAARVAQAGTARALVEQHRPGKEGFEQAEAQLKELRERDRLLRALEQTIARQEKGCLELGQKLEHETNEVRKTERDLGEEQQRLRDVRQSLAPDPAQVQAAARVKPLREEAERLRCGRGLLDGRRAALEEGQGKLGEGICPFFMEPCKNIAQQQPRDVFSHKLQELDRQAADLDRTLAEIGRDLATAEQAEKDLGVLQARAAELDKQQRQLEARQAKNAERGAGLTALRTEQAAATAALEERRTERKGFEGLEDALTAAERKRAGFQAARDAYFAHLKDAEDLDARQQTLDKWQQALEDLKTGRQAARERLEACRKAYDAALHERTRRQKEELLGAVAALEQRIDGMQKEAVRLTEEIAGLTRIAAEIEAQLAAKKRLEEQETLVKYLRNRVFRNVSARLSERFREEISQRADRIYRTISEGDEELVWGDHYQIVLRDLAEGQVRERTDDQLSGGQTMSAVVALRLALLQTIGARVAFFDEPTSNLDASRRENLARAFRAIDVGREEVTEHWYDQLFLISHDVAFTEITDQMIPLGE